MQQIPILGPSSEGALIQVNAQRSQNLWPRIETAGARNMITLRKIEGLKLVDSAGTGGVCRSNGVYWKGREYVVIGGSFVSIDDNDAITAEGTMLTVSGRCVIARGRDYLLIVDGTYGYHWDGTTFTSDITTNSDADFPASPTHAVYMDGYFLVNESGTDNFYRSEFEDPTDWDPLIFEVAAASPDFILGLATYDRDIYALGEDTTQRYYNSGGVGFNFSPYPSVMQAGLHAPYSLVGSVYGVHGLFRTQEGGLVVATLAGSQLNPESNDDDNEEIDALSATSDAIGMVYTRQGLTFYALTFPSADVTKVFNIGKQLSHHRKSKDIGRWRVNGMGYTGKRILAFDYNNDNVYELDKDTYTENGEVIECERTTQFIAQNQNPLSCTRYEAVFKQGVGLISGQGSDPKVGLAVSRDGGKTYSGFRYQSMGGIGQYSNRNVWKQLGDFDAVMNTRIRYTEPTDFAILGGYGEFF